MVSLANKIGEKVTVVLTIIVIILVGSNLIPIVVSVANDLIALPIGSVFSVVAILLVLGLLITILQLNFGNKK